METRTGLSAAGCGTVGLAEAGLAEPVEGTVQAGSGPLGSGLTGSELAAGSLVASERQRVEAVVETLANLRGEGESLAEVAHDARNMVTALGLYCDLLEEPGVLAPSFAHYGNELRLVATASRRLVEKLVVLDARRETHSETARGAASGEARLWPEAVSAGRLPRSRRWDLLPAEPIDNLAAELLANRNLLAALAGPPIALTVDAEGGARPVRLTTEGLTRILVNLVKNAAEAMPAGGRIRLGLRERPSPAESGQAGTNQAGSGQWLALTVEDNGPGIPAKALDKIFESGYTTSGYSTSGNSDRPAGAAQSAPSQRGGWVGIHRGLGLSITRSIVEAAGGRIHAVNRTPAGARFEIALPVRTR